MSCGRARNGHASQSGLYLEVTESTQTLGKSRATDPGTHQCCTLATQGKTINANHVPITFVKVFTLFNGDKVQRYHMHSLSTPVFEVELNFALGAAVSHIESI